MIFDTLLAFIASSIAPAINVVQVNGYRTFGDGGAMFLYRYTGNDGTGLWTSADGAHWRIMPPQTPNWLMFGAFADAASHQITTGDIAANPQWIGTYAAGTEWSSVAAQECVYFCFATKSKVGNIIWNNVSTRLNHAMFIPRGTYFSNQTLLIVAEGASIHFEDRLGTSVSWTGNAANPALYFNSLAYGVIENMSVTDTVASTQLVVFDNNGSPASFKTQQLSIRDAVIQGGGPVPTGVLVAVNPVSGGSGQGDTILFENCIMTQSVVANLQLNGQNTLSVIVFGGNMQSAFLDGIACNGSTCFNYGGSFENGTDFFHQAPALNQFATGGADFHAYAGSGATGINSMRDIRSETNVPFIALPTNGRIEAVGVSGNVFNWSASNHYLPGVVISAGTKSHLFMLVDDGGPPWFLGDASGSVTTAVNLSASWTTNQWAGFNIWERFTNAGTVASVVTSNTATTATFSPAFGVTTAARQIKIGGSVGSSPPAWDSGPTTFSVTPNATGQGFTTTANSNVVTVGGSIFANINVGDYVVIIGAWSLGQAGFSFTSALIGKVSVKTSGPPTTITLTSGGAPINAAFSVTDALGYYGTGIVDNQETWLDIDSDALMGLLKADTVTVPFGRIRSSQSMEMMNLGRLDWDRAQVDANTGKFFSVNGYQQQQYPQAPTTFGAGTHDLTAAVANAGLLSVSATASSTLTWPTQPGPVQSFEINAKTVGSSDIVLTMGGAWLGPATIDLGSVNAKTWHISAQWDPNLAVWVHRGTSGPY